MDRSLSLITPTGHLTLGNLLGALRGMVAGAGDRRLLLRRQRPARDDDPARPRRAAGGDRRGVDPPPRGRPRPGAGDAVPAEPGARAPRAGLPARVHGVHRRAEPDDPVQGEGPRRRVDPGLALHLSGADGGRHPALPAVVGAGRRRPAPARRAHPRPRDPLQQHLRAGLHGARGDAAAGRRAGDGPAVADVEDVEVGPGRQRRDPAARPARRRTPEGGAGGHRLRHRARTPYGRIQRSRASPTCSTSSPRAAGSADGLTTYGALKAAVTDAVVAVLEPLQKAYAELAADPAYVASVFADGSARCRDVTASVLADATAAMGL